jgi:Zn-dependent peptidase ImmA (M78 family)
MRYERDSTGRFNRRPHYDALWIDEYCESIITDYVSGIGSDLGWPISTNTLTTMIEKDVDELDLYTNMKEHGLNSSVDGFTEYKFTGKPSVFINEKLSSKPYFEHRLRTTLMHEYGHVLLHSPLFRPDSPCKLLKLPEQWERPTPLTLSQRASSKDWMEWQANYAMGALLMPRTAVNELAGWYARKYGFAPPFARKTGHARDLVQSTCKQFLVSEEAALIRLKQMFFIREG